MDKQKLLKAGMWLSVTVLIIAIDANLLFIGFNNLRQDSYTVIICLLYTSPSPRDLSTSRMPSSA